MSDAIYFYYPDIQNGALKSELLEFIKEELATYIWEDVPGDPRIKPASYVIRKAQRAFGYSLSKLLEKFIEIAIARGVEAAISAFDKCTKATGGSCQKITLLRGVEIILEKPEIELDTGREVQVSDGVRLVALPAYLIQSANFPPYLFDDGFMTLLFKAPPTDFFRKTLIVIDCVVTPLFFQPKSDVDGQEDICFEIQSAEFPDFDVDKFCQALSLSCNAAIQPVFTWDYIDEAEIYSMRGDGVIGSSNSVPAVDHREAVRVSDAQIQEAKCLYKKLVNVDSGVRDKLQIPINRWIKSKAPGSYVDKMLDLGIAFESLYVPDGGGEVTYKFSIRAARHLGKDKEDRRKLLPRFKHIYGCRSDAIHEGKLNERPKFGKQRIPLADFIKKSQDYCRASIMKMLKDKCLPDGDYWNNLILGGEEEQESG